jgi:hypothetical protein
MTDNKEHHFFFAYSGSMMNKMYFKLLNFHSVEGFAVGATQYVRISLQKQKGRRVSNIPNVIREYNMLASERISPVVTPPLQTPFTCFKLSQPTHFDHMRLEATSPFWKWTAQPSLVDPKTIARLESIITEKLNIRITPAEIQVTYKDIARRYHEAYATDVDFDNEPFIMDELNRIFHSRLMLVEVPAAKDTPITAAVRAVVDHFGDMQDCEFSD